MQQLGFDLVVQGEYWVEVVGHSWIKDGRRYLVISESEHEGFSLCWRDGVRPVNVGALLHEKYIRRIENGD